MNLSQVITKFEADGIYSLSMEEMEEFCSRFES